MTGVTGVRRIEVSLAAMIAGVAMFTAFVPGAEPSEFGVFETGDSQPLSAPPTPGFSVSDFNDVAVSDAARAVAASLAGQRTDPRRFAAPVTAAGPAQRARSPVQVTPRAVSDSGPAWSGRTLGVDITAAPSGTHSEAHWWIVGGAGQESYAVAPGGLREFTVAPVAAQTTIGDAHMGLGFKVTDRAFASIGYVREQRKFVLGTEDWEEDEHYIGVGFQASW